MNNVIDFHSRAGKTEVIKVWQCQCGCTDFLLLQSGRCECSYCERDIGASWELDKK